MNERSASVEISIVIPLYNEQQNLEPLVEKIQETMSRLQRPYEIILILSLIHI